jgi:iron complex transport system ATP-binding protein
MSVLLADHIHVTRGSRTILRDVSLTAGPGELVAVIGPNGAGKSTLLSALAGLIAPSHGMVSLDAKPFAAYAGMELARRRAYLPQNPHLEWPLSVERLVALGLTPHLPALGDLPVAMQARVDAALANAGLAGQRDQVATTLSGGEFTRAMLARAMVGEPDILIVDEPVSGLDPRHAMDCMARLSAYAARGRLVIASLHELTLAARHASRIVALKDGRIAGEGAVADTLTPALIAAVFEVESVVRGTGANVTVDFLVS